MEATKPFHRNDLALANGVRSGRYGLAALLRGRALTIPQRKLRSANRAGVGLGVEAAVERVIILGLTLRTHREGFHRGVRAVIGQRFDDAEARAAVGAVGERVPIAAVGRVEDLAQAIGTGRDVREHQSGLGPAGFAWADFKASVAWNRRA